MWVGVGVHLPYSLGVLGKGCRAKQLYRASAAAGERQGRSLTQVAQSASSWVLGPVYVVVSCLCVLSLISFLSARFKAKSLRIKRHFTVGPG